MLGSVTAVAVQADGRILVGSSGAGGSNNQTLPGRVLIRLNADGSIDKGFTSPFTNYSAIAQLAILRNQQILASGTLLPLENPPAASIYRLNSDGTLDLSFQPEKQPATLHFFLGESEDITFLANGESFDSSKFAIVRLNSLGKVVQTIQNSAINSATQLFWVEPNGSLILGDGTHLARILPDGSGDPAFGSGPFFAGGYIRAVRQVMQQPDGAYVLAGGFVKTPGQIPLNLIRLRPTDQPVPPLITAMKAKGGGLALSVYTGGTGIYSLFASPGLPPANWFVITNLPDSADHIQVPIANPASNMFYRVGLP